MAFDVSGIEGGFNSFFGMLHTLFEGIRGMIAGFGAGYLSLILLALSLLGGYYLAKKFPSISAKWTWVVYGLIIFLMAKFI